MFRFKARIARNTSAQVVAPQKAAAEGTLMLLSVVIPARNEELCIASTVEHLHLELRLRDIPHEIIVVDDASEDGTVRKLEAIRKDVPELIVLRNPGPHGFGRANSRRSHQPTASRLPRCRPLLDFIE